MNIVELGSVYEFLYNPSCCESVAATVSIHKTPEGAIEAMELHKLTKKEEWEKNMKDEDEEYKEEFLFDFDQWWGTRETKLML